MRVLLAVGVAMVAGAGLSPASGASPRSTRIVIDDVAFKRPQVTAKKGTTVTWKSKDAFVTHTVKSRGTPRFDSSGDLQEGDTHRAKFSRRGVYRYICTVHPANMRGRITVK